MDIIKNPGPIMLFGSGETSPSGQKIFDHIMRALPPSPKIALIETPAGFELNSAMVIFKIAEFLKTRLTNYNPTPISIPARKKNSAFSPDNSEIVAPILEADLIFMGPGSPTYAVRQLQNSLTWYYSIARHSLGAGLAFSSAAVIASGAYALPIYEIYKVGEDLHWKKGLDLFAHFGLELTFVPHWNNMDGGTGLDTSRCFMGKSRFEDLLRILPENQTIVGIDEHTGLFLNCSSKEARVIGKGTVTIMNDGDSTIFERNSVIPFRSLGNCRETELDQRVPSEVWKKALEVEEKLQNTKKMGDEPTEEILILVKKREEARKNKDWALADLLREEIFNLGWQIADTPEGSEIRRSSE